MLDQIQIEDIEDFEFDLTEIGLVDFSLVFQSDEETNEFEIFISGNDEVYYINDLIENSLIAEESKQILFINSEQKEVINDLLKSLMKNNTNKIDSHESK